MPDGRVLALARAGWDRRGAVEPGEAGFGEAPDVADADKVVEGEPDAVLRPSAWHRHHGSVVWRAARGDGGLKSPRAVHAPPGASVQTCAGPRSRRPRPVGPRRSAGRTGSASLTTAVLDPEPRPVVRAFDAAPTIVPPLRVRPRGRTARGGRGSSRPGGRGRASGCRAWP